MTCYLSFYDECRSATPCHTVNSFLNYKGIITNSACGEKGKYLQI